MRQVACFVIFVMVEICPPESCTGCMACAASCGSNAIEPFVDDIGFKHPRILQDKCIDCGLCQRVCPSVNPPKLVPPLATYAVAAKNHELLRNSASGGVAGLLTARIINQGGVVYGCDGSNILHVQHRRAETLDQAACFSGSKYLQSDISGIYRAVKTDLVNGRTVLVIGISCQIAGLKKYLRKDWDNLYTIGIICHGGASQKMVDDNADYYCKKFGIDNIHNVKFRKKLVDSSGNGRIQYGFYFESDGKQYNNHGFDDPFTFGYGTNILFRDSCYQCHYTRPERVADLTIGDFWGLGADAGFKVAKGVSVAIPHTPKGVKMIDSLSSSSRIVPRDFAEAVSGNPQLIKPTRPGFYLKKFRRDFPEKGFARALKGIRKRFLWRVRIASRLKRFGMPSLASHIWPDI